jgi:putative transcriptional regulator
MTPSHHPSEDILIEYAAGALAPGFGLVVGAHLEMCSSCRARVGAFEAASGDGLESLPTAEIRPDALTKLMTRLDAQAPARRRETRPLVERLPLKRRKWVAPGVWAAAVDTPHAPHDRVYVLSVGVGMPTAQHTHSGAELCTVLRGAYRDELGVFRAGDFAAADGAVEHRPVVEGDEPCVCLFATEGRLKPRGLIGRIAFSLADV